MELTERQKAILFAALSYAMSNVDDLNDCMSSWDYGAEDKIEVNGTLHDRISGIEFNDLAKTLGIVPESD